MTPVEKPALPQKLVLTSLCDVEKWKAGAFTADQMHAYADTCMAPLLARIEELEAQNRSVCLLLLDRDREGVMAYAKGLLCKEFGGKFSVEVMADSAALSATKEP